MMRKRFLAAAGISCMFAVTGCGGNATSGPPLSSVNPVSPSYSTLQFAVGTANLYGNAQPGLNVVSTFRQTTGQSATGVNSPAISGPLKIIAPAAPSTSFADPYTTAILDTNQIPPTGNGPSISEEGGSSITSTPQTVAPGTPACDGSNVLSPFIACPPGLTANTTTFGQSGGDFAMGLGPYNAVASTGQAYSYQPYPQPFYSSADATTAYQFIPWGGPPAFDPNHTGMGERDGVGAINGIDSFGFPYFLGVGEGITVFDGVTASGGTYTLNVAVATVGNGGSVTTSNVTKSATLNAAVVLPTLTAPVFTPDGNGGGTLTTALPPGVTEAYIQIVDFGPGGGPNDGGASLPSNCQGARGTSFAPVYYTLHVTAAASTTYTLPDSIGPNLNNGGGASALQPSPTICTAAQNTAAAGAATAGDDIAVQMIGFNYPVYQAALGLTQASTPSAPPIANASGQADITISRAQEQDNGSTTQSPLSVKRRSAFSVRRIHR